MRRGGPARSLAWAQGAYYLATGLWPIFHRRSFEAVTGPKREWWLVKMVGALAASIGWSLIGAARAPAIPPESRRLALTSALSFAAIDLWYGGARRRISPVYLVEAVPELALAALWARSASFSR